MTEKEKELDLLIAEQQDGSVTVEGDFGDDLEVEESAPSTEQAEQKAEGGFVPEDGGDDQPDDTEAIRAARRQKRKAKKEYHKQQQAEKDLRFQQLMRENQELRERVSAVEQKTHGSELARIDKAIEDQHMRIQYARMKISEATQAQDGEAMSNAQDMLYEARRAVESLENLKKQASSPKQQAPTAPDRTVQRYAANWMERNSWYDPAGKDEDSEIALTIDKRMVREGWDPKTREYWEELDDRLQKRLPHLYTNEEAEDPPIVKRPRSVVTGSGRESAATAGGKNSFVLTPDQVRAMKDAGMWEDEALRMRMIKRYARESRQQRN
jgi:hypothetical protein